MKSREEARRILEMLLNAKRDIHYRMGVAQLAVLLDVVTPLESDIMFACIRKREKEMRVD